MKFNPQKTCRDIEKLAVRKNDAIQITFGRRKDNWKLKKKLTARKKSKNEKLADRQFSHFRQSYAKIMTILLLLNSSPSNV